MRQKIFRALALVLVVVLIGVIFPGTITEAAGEDQPAAETTEIKLTETQKILYLGECTGKKANGKKAKFSSSVKVRKLISGFSTKKYDISLKSANELVASVDSEKDIIYAEGVGKTTVTVTVKAKKSNGKLSKKKVLKAKLKIQVMKNANLESFKVEGISDGQSLYIGDSLTVSMPGDYTDLRTIVCEDEEVSVKALKGGKSFSVTFNASGEYIVTAASYQSEEYNGYTAFADFEVIVKEKEAEARQISLDTIELVGGPVDEDMTAEDITVFEISNGVKVFYSYASKVKIDGKKAVISLFNTLQDEKQYELRYDGLSFRFKSGSSDIDSVAVFQITNDSIIAGENNHIEFQYFNRNGLDITKKAAKTLNGYVTLSLLDEDAADRFVSGRYVYATNSGEEIGIAATLEMDSDGDGTPDIVLSTQKNIAVTEKKGKSFTGKAIYTVKPNDGKSFDIADMCENSAVVGDDVVFEAFIEMDDGSYKSLKQAGITKLMSGDEMVLMIGTETPSGGCRLILNSSGETAVMAYREDECVVSFHISVLPERKPDKLRAELSKSKLNTNEYIGDSLLIKADVLDQYGKVMEDSKFEISQTAENKALVGEINIEQISDGRFVVYGYECPKDKNPKRISAIISSGSLSSEIGFYICDVEYDIDSDAFEYALKVDGRKLIDTSLSLDQKAPESTFVTIEITDDGYFVGEGIGYFFAERPSVANGADYYGVEPGEKIYGMSVLYTDSEGGKRYLSEDEPCVLQSYLEIELCPYMFGEKLPTGTYEITAYSMTVTEEHTNIKTQGYELIRVIDLDPEIEVQQMEQSYSNRLFYGWEEEISDFFSFRLDGEDISEYITKVDCVEASNGNVFVKSVEFRIPNSYYGFFTKTAVVERLITKQ